MKDYPALHIVASLCKLIGVILGLAGIGASIFYVSAGFRIFGFEDYLRVVIGISGILISIVASIMVYALGDFYTCIMKIEYNTRQKEIESPKHTILK